MTAPDEPAGAGSEGTLEDDLVSWGRVIEIETRGRRSGTPRRVTVGYVERPDGGLAVAASEATTDWARNLVADPRCRVRDAHRWRDCVAVPLGPVEHAEVVTALVLRYGTPAERLGRGPSFALVCPGEAGAPSSA